MADKLKSLEICAGGGGQVRKSRAIPINMPKLLHQCSNFPMVARTHTIKPGRCKAR